MVLNIVLLSIVIALVAALLPLTYSLGKRNGEYKEYTRAREEIKEILGNV